MGLSSAVRWWEEWQLRVLVLSSLGVQFFLAVFGAWRKSRIPPWFRVFIWLSYLGSDALAIYALATLFNRQRKHGKGGSQELGPRQRKHGNGGSQELEVVWAPVLLIHLGGQMFITAYNMEDKRRHILTSVSQITVALYVFCKSWSSSTDRRLSVAEILLFIVGIVKCFEKPMALKAASFHSLARSKYHDKRAKDESSEEQLESFIRDARASLIQKPPVQYPHGNLLSMEDMNLTLNELHLPSELFVDSTHPYSVRLENLKFLWSNGWPFSYYVIRDGLSNIFNLLYTRNKFRAKDASVASFLLWANMASNSGTGHPSHWPSAQLPQTVL
uniref:DUF4220 domain-containing protein n=1 Tax=Oryza brachyantha TaxID=4533 RepID=J3MQC4_ORYBR